MATNVLAGAFVGLDEVKAGLGISGSDVDRDGLIVALINRSSDLFQQYTGRRLLRATYANQAVDGTGEACVFLPEYPVISVSSLKLSATREFASSDALTVFDGSGSQSAEAFDVVLDAETGELELVNGDIWPEGKATVLASYVAGYDAVDVQDLVQAQIQQVSAWWFEVGRDQRIKATSLDGITQQLTEGDLVAEVKAALVRYRRPAALA